MAAQELKPRDPVVILTLWVFGNGPWLCSKGVTAVNARLAIVNTSWRYDGCPVWSVNRDNSLYYTQFSVVFRRSISHFYWWRVHFTDCIRNLTRSQWRYWRGVVEPGNLGLDVATVRGKVSWTCGNLWLFPPATPYRSAFQYSSLLATRAHAKISLCRKSNACEYGGGLGCGVQRATDLCDVLAESDTLIEGLPFLFWQIQLDFLVPPQIKVPGTEINILLLLPFIVNQTKIWVCFLSWV